MLVTMFDKDKAARLVTEAIPLSIPLSQPEQAARKQLSEAKDLIMSMTEQLRAAMEEVERMRGCLARANENHEDFERRWYLVMDARDSALADVARLTAENERMRAVFVAAKVYHATMTEPAGDRENNASSREQHERHDEAVRKLLAAINAAERTKP